MKKKATEDIVKDLMKNVVKYISVIAIILVILVMAFIYFGPEITLNFSLITKFTVASIVLCISMLIIYELWSKNGQEKGREDKEYIDTVDEFTRLSSNMDYASMQSYLDYEEKRRYDVEYDTYTRLITRDTDLLTKLMTDIETRKESAKNLDPKDKNNKRKIKKLTKVSLEDKIKIRSLNKRIKMNTRRRANIIVRLPYVKSEEFDYLRYNLNTDSFKEYSPDDTKKFLRFHRTKRYMQSITLAIFGINMISIGTTMSGNWWYAIFMTMLTIVSIILVVFSGFSVGYKSISIVSLGVYKTANEYINKAIVYLQKEGKSLYYKETPVEKSEQEVKEEKVEEVKQEQIVEKVEEKHTISIY